MADSKISNLTELTTPAAGDELVIVDKSDTTQAATGTTKKINHTNLLGSVLETLKTVFTPASASSPASIDLAEDKDNGTNKITVTAPSSIASDKTITLPDATDTLVGKDTTDTLTNKTLTSPVINAITGTDHITITPATSKLVKLAVLRQDNTTNAYKNNTVILTGWGAITGDSSSNKLSESVTFGITFSEPPIIICTASGAATVASAPDSIDDYTSSGGATAQRGASSASSSTTGFEASVFDAAVLSSAVSYSYSWIAISQLN